MLVCPSGQLNFPTKKIREGPVVRLFIGLRDFAIEKVVSAVPLMFEARWTGKNDCPNCGCEKLRVKDSSSNRPYRAQSNRPGKGRCWFCVYLRMWQVTWQRPRCVLRIVITLCFCRKNYWAAIGCVLTVFGGGEINNLHCGKCGDRLSAQIVDNSSG